MYNPAAVVYLLLFVVSFCLVRSQAAVAGNNYEAWCNGLGACDAVMKTEAGAPMSYRVLMSLLLRFIPQGLWEVAYESFMVLGCWGLLSTMFFAHGLIAALLLAILLFPTFRYDYWCWIPEVGAFAAASAGSFALCAPWFFAAALSKETAALLPLAFLCGGGSVQECLALGAVVGVPTLLVRKWQGKKQMHCDRVHTYLNGRELGDWIKAVGRPAFMRHDMTGSVALTAATVYVAMEVGVPGALPSIAMLAAGWVFARASETRVFASCLVMLATYLSGLV